MKKNLLRETIERLSENGKSPSGVLWVGRSMPTEPAETRELVLRGGLQ